MAVGWQRWLGLRIRFWHLGHRTDETMALSVPGHGVALYHDCGPGTREPRRPTLAAPSPGRALARLRAAADANLQAEGVAWPCVARFAEYPLMARVALLGGALAAAGYVLPIAWFVVRLRLTQATFNGLDLVVAPAVLDRIGTPGAGDASVVVAALAGLALLMAVAAFLMALAPGIRSVSDFHPRGGFRVAVVGAASTAAVMLAFPVFLGPLIGTTGIGLGGFLTLVGFILAAAAWPRTEPLGEPGAAEDASANPG